MFTLILCLTITIPALNTVLHFEGLNYLSRTHRSPQFSPRSKVLMLMLILPLFHFAEISVYAVAYYALRDYFHTGTLLGAFADRFSTYLYFSMETYTSLGFGDVVPEGITRLLAGVEVLNGILLIGWSGSYVFVAMQNVWQQAHNLDLSQATLTLVDTPQAAAPVVRVREN